VTRHEPTWVMRQLFLNDVSVEANSPLLVNLVDALHLIGGDGTFAREDFRYNHDSDTYTCPAGKTLATSGTLVNDGATLLYRGSTLDCGTCQFKARCCSNTPARKIPRSLHERARNLTRSLVGTAAFEQSRRDRKRVEMLFAHLKRILKIGRLRLRGPKGAQDEFTLAAITQNLRRLAKLVAHPPPAAACVA